MKNYQIRIRPIDGGIWRYSVEFWHKSCLDGSWYRGLTFYAKSISEAASEINGIEGIEK